MDFVELKTGKSVEGADIKSFRSNHSRPDKYIYLMAGVHGDEVEGAYVLKKLFSWLQEQNLETPFIVIPELNVDGLRSGTRINSNGVDLNRNLPTSSWQSEFKEAKYNPGPEALSEPENKYFVTLMEKFPPAFIISFHTWKPLINFNGDCEDIADFISKKNNYPTAADIGYPTPGSLGTYGPETFNSPVITFECPELSDELSLDEIWKQSAQALIDLLEGPKLKRFL